MLKAYPGKKKKSAAPRRQKSVPRGLRRKAGALVAACIVFAAGAVFSHLQTGGPGNNVGGGAPEGTGGYRVLQVPDGDSLVLGKSSGKKERIRLYGVDAPELHQRGGKASAKFAHALLQSENVSLRVMDKDQYDRVVAIVILPDGRMLNEEMVKAGHAWVYRAHCHTEPMCSSWYALERQAKKEGRGLWRDASPTPPWQWRRQNPRR